MNYNRLLLCVTIFASPLLACGGSGASGPTRIESSDPAVDERLDALGIYCESTYTITGTFTPAEGADLEECPDGEWRITLASDFVGCDPQPDITAEEYVYQATTDEENGVTSVIYVPEPNAERVNLKVTIQAGDLLCSGDFDHFLDGNEDEDEFPVYSIRPILNTDLSITGTAKYSVFDSDPF